MFPKILPLTVAWFFSVSSVFVIPFSGASSLFEEVKFLTRDGVTIAGSYYPPLSRPAPAVILLHMLNRNRHDWDRLAFRLRGLGLAVLSIDLRGHGESIDQRGKTLSWNAFQEADFNKMVLDVEAALLYLSRKKEEIQEDRLSLVGASIGCNVALNFAADHPEVRSLILLSPGLDYRGIHADLAMERYAASHRPVLIVASAEDKYAAESSQKLDRFSAGQSELLLYQGAGHGTRMFAKEKGLEEKIMGWLQKTLQLL